MDSVSRSVGRRQDTVVGVSEPPSACVRACVCVRARVCVHASTKSVCV